MAQAVRDRSQDNKQNTLGLFSDLNYTTINDPYDDNALRRMLGNRLGECSGARRACSNRSATCTCSCTGAISQPPTAAVVLMRFAERPGHGRYKLPTLKTAPRLPKTQEWKRSASWKASSYPKRGTMS